MEVRMLDYHRVAPRSMPPGSGTIDAPLTPQQLMGRMVVDWHDGIRLGDVDMVFVDRPAGAPRYMRLAIGGIRGNDKTYGLIPTAIVIGFVDERLMVDSRLIGSVEHAEGWQPLWNIPRMTSVLAADNDELGIVTEVHPGFIVAEPRIADPDDFYIPNDAIALFCGQYLRLALTRDDALKQGWNLAPPHLIRAELDA
jgi:hypothetical protein